MEIDDPCGTPSKRRRTGAGTGRSFEAPVRPLSELSAFTDQVPQMKYNVAVTSNDLKILYDEHSALSMKLNLDADIRANSKLLLADFSNILQNQLDSFKIKVNLGTQLIFSQSVSPV